MEKIKLEILGIEIPKLGFEFTDLGYVDSIKETIRKLEKKHGYEEGELQNPKQSLKRTIGLAKGFGELISNNIFKNNYIFYLKQNKEEDNIHLRAHEETHALEHMNGLSHLEKNLLENQKVKIKFKEIRKSEVRAEIGAIYALIQRGIIPSKISCFPWDFDFRRAKKLYYKLKISD